MTGETEELGKVDVAEAAEVGTACHKVLEAALKKGIPPHELQSLAGTSVTIVTRNDGSEHARLSPSGAERWCSCPGSVVMTPKVVESAPRSVTVELTAEMLEWVEVALRWVLEYLRDNPGCVVYSEERARAGVPFGCPDEMWGTADVVIVNRAQAELVVADGKFGYNEVLAAGNKQLFLYAIGLANDWGWAFKTHRLAILQPRSAVPVKVEVLDEGRLREEMERLRVKVADALDQWRRAAEGEPLQLVPTDDGCKWCEAGPVCPALQKRALELARREFFEPELLPRASLVELLKAADRIRDGLNKAEAHAMRLLELGQEVAGFKRVRGVKREVWTNEAAAGRTLVQLGVKPDEVWKAELQFTPNQARKKLGKHFAELLDGLSERPLGEPCLAAEEDPRLPLPPDFEPC